MQKLCWLLAGYGVCFITHAQLPAAKRITKNVFTDSVRAQMLAEGMIYELPVIALNESDKEMNGDGFLPSVLQSNRDVLTDMAAFHFGVVRFRLRGYEGRYTETRINGVSMNNPDDGNTGWRLWSGLNDVTRNSQSKWGLQTGEPGFVETGGMNQIDMRASKQRIQEQMGYQFSNRNITHRWTYSKSLPMNRKGWAFCFSGSLRASVEGYVPGTGSNGESYYLGIDKKTGEDGLLSVVLFGSAELTGRQGAATEEIRLLAGSVWYNPYWGYQGTGKRNANMSGQHQPVLLITHEQKLGNRGTWVHSLGLMAGEKRNTGLDWYDAPDPRPDYYRYLPSYQKDPVLQEQLKDAFKNDESLRQINWDHLYTVNRNNATVVSDVDGIIGNRVSGLRSHYIVADKVNYIKRAELSSVYQIPVTEMISFSGGISFQLQESRYYKRVEDLLGGNFFMDLNQFAENDLQNSQSLIQNDLRFTNHLVRKGDTYGYDYSVNTQKARVWCQINGVKRKWDYYIGASLQYLFYQRNGYMQNGLFPERSFGKSTPNEFTDYAFRTGVTYKINGRKYVYAGISILSDPPLFSDVFISPATRDDRQEKVISSKIQSAEAGYLWNAPAIRLRLSAYYTRFADGLNVMTFYHDGYSSLVNYALSGIDKVHFGIEAGMDKKLTKRFSMNIGVSVGRYYEQSRERATVTADNDASVLERTIIYSKNFLVAGTPQEAFGVSIRYQSKGFFYCNLNWSLFREQWIDYNPLRRTYSAVENIVKGTEKWDKMIGQFRLPDRWVLDFSAGSSFRSRLPALRKRRTILLYLNINNLLNNRQIISGGYEQLRYDAETKDPDKYPPKFFYAMGLNFSVNINVRL